MTGVESEKAQQTNGEESKATEDLENGKGNIAAEKMADIEGSKGPEEMENGKDKKLSEETANGEGNKVTEEKANGQGNKSAEETPNEEGNKAEETSNEDPSQLELDIIRQIEYYFGDCNLPRDKFLQEQLKLDDGWVPLAVLTKFHRLAKLTTDTAVICSAIGKSTTGLMEVSEDGTKIRRSPEHPLPELNEERRKELMARTVYAKGFPLDSNVDICLKFFKDYPGVVNVIMRRYQDRQTKKWQFKGSVFATFKQRDQAEAFLKIEGLKYGDTEMVKMWQEDYMIQKQQEYASRKEQKKQKEKKEKEPEKHDSIKFPLGAVLHFEDATDASREQIKQALVDAGAEVAFIDFQKGDSQGWVRLQGENTAQTFFDKLTEGKLKVDEKEITLKVLSGEEEAAFLQKTTQDLINRRKNSKSKHQGKGNRGRFGRKRKQDASDDAPPQKVKAAE